MDYSGERMMPEHSAGSVFWEHLHRYRFAARYVIGKDVLDIACGEGYGTRALMLAGAAHVIGVDLSAESCAHARARYGIDARVGDAHAIPLLAATCDVVVSFETIEHVTDPAAFLDECLRVLRPGGCLIISTPNAAVYGGLVVNEFHCSELTEEQFASLIQTRLQSVRWFAQSYLTAPLWSPRSLVASRSFWHRLKGFGLLARLCCPHYHGRVTAADRRDVVPTVLRSDGWLATQLDPFRVRKHTPGTTEQPTYLVAVGVKP